MVDYVRWNACSNTRQCVIFLKHLKRASLSSSHLLHVYTLVIISVLDYALLLWHSTLTKSQTERLEAVQQVAINIIFVTLPPPPIFLHWRWLTFHLLKQDTWIFLSEFLETFVDLTIIYTTFFHPSRASRDIPAQEAHCIPQAKPPN